MLQNKNVYLFSLVELHVTSAFVLLAGIMREILDAKNSRNNPPKNYIVYFAKLGGTETGLK